MGPDCFVTTPAVFKRVISNPSTNFSPFTVKWENLFPAGTYLLHTAASAKMPPSRIAIDAAAPQTEKLHEAQPPCYSSYRACCFLSISTHRLSAPGTAGIAFFSLWLTIKEPTSRRSSISTGLIKLAKRIL
jgi:hypothetical protein